MSARSEPPELFSNLLRQARLAAAITQEELAERSGLSVRAIGDLERGRTAKPHGQSARNLANALELSQRERTQLLRVASLAEQRFAITHSPGNGTAQSAVALLPVTPAQLPADVADFTGRGEQVRQLCRQITSAARTKSPGAVTVSMVTGPAGIGKSMLAVHAAHRIRDRFPDGQLYASLKDAAGQALVSADLLERFLRDLGADSSEIPDGLQERAACYRSRLARRAVLIVLDDALDAAQVRPLIPGTATCTLIVTSRSFMSGLEAGITIDLGVLSRSEAYALFVRIIGQQGALAEPDDVKKVLDACADLPLAIRLAGTRLAARPGWRVHDLAARLTDKRLRMDELALGDRAVRASFQTSYAALSPSAHGDPARTFRILGLWRGKDCSLPAAAAMLGRSGKQAESDLDLLTDIHLVGSPTLGRYKFHSLLQVYAGERAEEQESVQARHEAMRRLLTWYLHTAAAAARILVPLRGLPPLGLAVTPAEPLVFETRERALQWCNDELANLITATVESVRHGLHDVAWKLPVTLRGFFDLGQRWTEWIATHRLALDSARLLGDCDGEAHVLDSLGVAHGQQLQSGEALTYLRRALQLRRQAGDCLGEVLTLNNLGNVFYSLQKLEESAACYSQSLVISRNADYAYGHAIALSNLGQVHWRMGRFNHAAEVLQMALATARDIGDLHTVANVLDRLGNIFLDLERFAEAAGYGEEALAIQIEMGDRCGEASAKYCLGRALGRSGQSDRALKCLEHALAIFEQLGHPAADGVRRHVRSLAGRRPRR